MRKPWLIGVACALVAGIAIYFTLSRPSDEDKIKKVLSDFASIVTVRPSDSYLSRSSRLRTRLGVVVRDDVAVRVDEMHVDIRGRQKLEEDAAKVGLLYQDAECTFINTKIEIDPAATFAKVDTTALVTAKMGGERKIDKRAVHVLLRKDGEWKIDTLDVAAVSD